MVGVASPSGLERALTSADGTVTRLLEQLVGEPIDAEPESHRMVEAAAVNSLAVPPGHPLLCRAARLRGRRSGRVYVLAVSVLVPSRLPTEFGAQLETGHRPIGRLLESEGIDVVREALAGPDPLAESIWPDPAPPAGVLVARTYRVHAAGAPVMVISERFLATLAPYLPPD
jgi:chorismate-pyruvate lyase